MKLENIEGVGPFPRGGHSAALLANDDKIIIFGGWSNTTQFADLWIFDILNNTWVETEVTHEIPRWYHSGLIVPAIPSWKYFIFGGSVGNFEEGGNRTLSRINDDSYVLDLNLKNIKSLKWEPVSLENPEKPRPREASAMFYDSNESRLVLFGGWSNMWMDDISALSVSLITGPPYAIYDIKPKLGPLTGKTKIFISGDGFIDSGNINIKFLVSNAKGLPLEVQGNYISPNEIWCETPNFETFGAKKADVRISINKGDFTITSSNFTYYLNTKADRSIAYGPGLLQENLVSHETVFIIQARNTKGFNRESGSDVFHVKITAPLGIEVKSPLKKPKKRLLEEETAKEDQLLKENPQEDPKLPSEEPIKENENEKAEEKPEEEVVKQEEEMEDVGTEILYEIIDNDDGSYLVKYTIDSEVSNLRIDVNYCNEQGKLEPIRGSPFFSGFKTGVSAKNNELTGNAVFNYIGNSLNEIEEFITTTKDNINIRNINKEEVKELLNVIKNLQKVGVRKDEIYLTLDVLEQTVKMLEKQEFPRESDLKKILRLQEEWTGLQKMAAAVEKDIALPVKTEGDKAKDNLMKFEEMLKEYFFNMKKESFYSYRTGIDSAFGQLDVVATRIQGYEKTLKEFEEYSKMFNFPEAISQPQKNLDQVKGEINAVRNLWVQIKKLDNQFTEYKERKWVEVDTNDMEDEVKKLRKELMDLRGIDKKSNCFQGINDDVKKWATFLPLLGELKDKSMEVADDRHWNKIRELVKKDVKVTEEMPLSVIWDLKLFDHKDGIEEITDKAKQELKMDGNINKVTNIWKQVDFELVKHKDTNIFTLKMLDDNFEQLEEHQLQINNMLLSKFVAHFEKIVEKWKQDLGSVYDVVQLLTDVQKSWSFLENLFIHSEEVKKELPKESENFVDIDKDMKAIMQDGGKVKNILLFCTKPGMLKQLEEIQKQLKICEKALNDFLDGKRRAFPRFYFVSVNDLLDILSNGNNPEKVNRHMSKIFQAIEKLELEDIPNERPKAKTMVSCVGVEKVDFTVPLKLAGKVENYLTDCINTMQTTLLDIVKSSLPAQAQTQKDDWIKRDPAQITLLVNMIVWCRTTEKAFSSMQGGDLEAMKNYLKEVVESLTGLIKMVQGDLSRPLRQKIMCLITMDTHSRDMVDKLIVENVRKPDEFQWQSQLKFYWDTASDKAILRIADASFFYAYEYLGNGPRLVVTPLTDRIYVTATQALHLKMGCAPAGPAGTGKTETTKDLSNANAKACYVFNCSGEMNYESMGNIFKGLASSGCWGCFDEFNRLVPEVLSVCSVQFKSVTDAIKAQKERFVIEGDEISLDPTCGVFITMNPGYLGRSELPEGLKALFRPITVVVPDLELICENMLMAEGFVRAKLLAKKFVTLYTLCKDLLSKSDHYDWGLRAIKSVLVVAGTFKRAEMTIDEGALLMRALRDFNTPKIIAADLEIFFGLLGDLFPGVEIERKRDVDFEKVIEQVTIEGKQFPAPEFILKVVQLGELLEIRHCVFIMGPPGSGKTSTWRTLTKANDKIGKKTSYVDLNPKVVSTKDLYGYNLPSKEWKDGLFSKLMRAYAEIPDNNPKWLLLDGDLDANWIESMNSVMDDNKILTLANNERIPLKPHMRMLFEIRDLKFATPATVSRAGILYISDDSGHQWKSYYISWLEITFQDETMKENLKRLFERYVGPTLEHIRKHCKFVVPITFISMVISFCKCLNSLLLNQEVKNIEYLFVYALIWALGGALTEKDGVDYRKEFSGWWKGEWKTSVKYPVKGTVFDYYVDTSGDNYKFEEWGKKVEAVDFDTQKGMIMSDITVHTRETVATSEFVKNFILIQHPVLLIGNAGCGKTQLCKGILNEIVKKYPENYTYQFINFNFYTDSAYLQGMLEQQLEKKAGRQFGPHGKMRMIYFIDDLNMPQLDDYNTQTAIELLRQHADYGHWYDIGKLALKDIINTQHLAALNPTAGSFYVNPRYKRHFWTVSIPFPDNESLFLIYATFLNGHLKHFKPNVQEYATPIIKAALLLHGAVVSTFRKTAINFHYQFNIRHIANVFQGLLITLPAQFQDPEKIVKLWIHESERTYGDRLVSLEHLSNYKTSIMFDLLKKNFSKFNFNRYFQQTGPENLIFCNFINGLGGDRFYDLMSNDKSMFHVTEALREYNDGNPVMNLVLFDDAMKHICKITRIVFPPSGHALLVGVGGSGKQSLAKLASFIMGYTTFSVTISATYSMNDLRTDLQGLYQKTGVKDEGILFLFTEGQITNERFLVYINDLLSSGEIAELYTSDEKELIINVVRPKVKQDNIPDTRENCWSWFIGKVRKNLHMALCFSPVGESFRRRARQFPALVNCTVIDWFQPWPQDALYSVAENFLDPIDLGEDLTLKKSVVEFMPYSFKVVNNLSTLILEQEKRYIYTTPKSFLELIKLYTTMLSKKRTALENNKERYETGLIKLVETEERVVIIEKDVTEKQVEAEAKKKEADAFAETVGTEKAKVEKESDKANIEADKCSKIKTEVEKQKKDTQADLDAAIPLVEQAKSALDDINKKDFQVAKSWNAPPGGVLEVFASCLYLLAGFFPEAIEVDPKSKKPKNIDWKSCLKLMKSPDEFLNKLKTFKDTVDANLVPVSNVNAVKNLYLSQPFFTMEEMANKSNAAKGICGWVINIVKYWEVIQVVEPKRNALKEAVDQLDAATKQLNEVEERVNKLKNELQTLVDEFDKADNAKKSAIAEAERYALRLSLAQRLVRALGSEKERWKIGIEELDKGLKLLPGDVLLASGFISYAGPFNKKFRETMIKDYFLKFFKEKNIPMSASVDPVALMTNDATIAKWNKQFLPSDRFSVENGAILTNSERYPLIIDPQLQGIIWLKEREKDHNLKCCRLGSKDIIANIELAIENGYSALIENIDERIDAILMPVIARAYINRGKNKLMKFGGKDLLLNDNFILLLHSKLSNPHYPPEIQAECTLINFTVTEQGLGDQLLVLVVSRERPDLARKKIELITQQNDFKIKLKELEDEILFKLVNVKGDILDDIALIENLENSKKISVEVTIKVEIAKTTEIKINHASEAYRSAATRGALIYFLLTDLAKIHSFYKYSLDSYIVVINRAIDVITEKKTIEVEEKPKEEGEEDGENNNKPLKTEEEKEEEKKPEEGEALKEEEEEKNDNVKEPGTPPTKNKSIVNNELLEDPLSPRSLNKRVDRLLDSITYTSFTSTRRGLFEKHKIIVSSMLCLRILLRNGDLEPEEVNHLILGKIDLNPGPIPDVLKNFITEIVWAACKGLETVGYFQTNQLCQSLEVDHLQWKKWYNEEKAETATLPKQFKEINNFHKLLLLRAMRPDRLSSALTIFIGERLGEKYIEQLPFNMDETFSETSPITPIFFVLFPGVDPTPDVEHQGAKLDISIANGRFKNISMGQGQENLAKNALFDAAKKGNWIMLQNVHLMQSWLKGLNGLEGFLEQVFVQPHPSFRCFISSEQPPFPSWQIIPESILQSALKVANEAPQDLKANMRRAYNNLHRAYTRFEEDFSDKVQKKNEFKANLFGLCFFHSLVLGRRKFGPLGWSRPYSFNDGDLTICADVLQNYLAKYDQIPYDDLRYIYGEIMYGGHITDGWDRRTCATYLKVLIKPELLQSTFQMAPHFKSPDPAKHDYDAYKNYIETKLPVETPLMFGMHPNAEIGYLTQQCETIFNTIMEISGSSNGSGSGKKEQGVLALVLDLKAKTPDDFNMFDITSKIKEKTPFNVVCLQECERMNTLLGEIKRSLEDLRRGFNGELDMTEQMDNLVRSLSFNKVADNWEKVAYPSKKSLALWFTDLIDRNTQLQKWCKELIVPNSLCISWLFNPMSYLTAVMQNTAREKKLPLDNMTLQTDITSFRNPEDIAAPAENGAYIHGLLLEGATWEMSQGQGGFLCDQIAKELHPKLPVVNVIAVPLSEKKTKSQYECPVYYTSTRGPTFVFTANLQMGDDNEKEAYKWVLAGVCLIMNED